MMRRQQLAQRYGSQRKTPFVASASREFVPRQKGRNSGVSAGRKSANNIISADIYSQRKIVRPKRGASAYKHASKSKIAQSMSKFRRDFINNWTQIDIGGNQANQGKASACGKGIEGMEGSVVVEELHYQMVKLQQNVKRMHHQ